MKDFETRKTTKELSFKVFKPMLIERKVEATIKNIHNLNPSDISY